jgi:hypothetical protein
MRSKIYTKTNDPRSNFFISARVSAPLKPFLFIKMFFFLSWVGTRVEGWGSVMDTY